MPSAKPLYFYRYASFINPRRPSLVPQPGAQKARYQQENQDKKNNEKADHSSLLHVRLRYGIQLLRG